MESERRKQKEASERARAVRRRGVAHLFVLAILSLMGCAVHEPGRFQVAHVDVKGQAELKERPLLSCLVTRERPSFGVTLGLSDASCGMPPFDSQAPRINLWRWWWTDWPAFNRAVFDQDLERIQRWYQARGYYQAKVIMVEFDPPQATQAAADSLCDLEEDVCRVSIVITVEEGEPTFVSGVEWQGIEELDEKVVAQVKEDGALKVGAPIDEGRYDIAKAKMLETLLAFGYAAAKVEGDVQVNTRARSAQVRYKLTPGPTYTFGSITLSGQGELSKKRILAAGALPQDTTYSPEEVNAVQAEIYALGAFSSVEINEKIDKATQKVDLEIQVRPHSPHALRVGIGVLSGAQQRTDTGELASIPQWDLHLYGRYEKRHIFGSLGRLTVEERPRMIYSAAFPVLTPPQLGNVVSVRLNQPGLLERRTDLFTEEAWDFGPDPYLGFHRSDLYFRVGARRGFFHRRLLATLAVQQDLFLVGGDVSNRTSDGSELPSTYGYTFLEEDLRLDLRDDRMRPRWGTYFGLNATQAQKWKGSDWTAYRLAPEARGYLPLFFDIVWANRLSIAGLFIKNSSEYLDETSRRLGPTNYRLRGGGANSNRGFLAGTLGVGLGGGLRRWEATSELRVPLGKSVVIAGFADVGDVNDEKKWRFEHLNLSVGGGIRYYTILGAIRLDVGFRIPSLQRLDGSDGIKDDDSDLFGTPGALHLTIGDPF